jgi:hypothetical protein
MGLRVEEIPIKYENYDHRGVGIWKFSDSDEPRSHVDWLAMCIQLKWF